MLQMMERLGGTGLLPRFSASESMMFQTEPLLDPGMVGTLLAGTVKLGSDLIFGAFWTLKVWWISSIYNDRFIVMLAPH
jgi:hypothetical protein